MRAHRLSARRVAHVLRRLLDDELELYLATRSLEASAVGASALDDANAFARQAHRLDEALAVLVFELRRANAHPGPSVADALLVSDLMLVFGGDPAFLSEAGLEHDVAASHALLRRRLSSLAAVYAGAHQVRLSGVFRRLAASHGGLADETPGASSRHLRG
jgi:hypothetical protein